MKTVFDLRNGVDESSIDMNEPNSSWCIRHFDGASIVAAPSSAPSKRRANTADTFEFFIDKFHVPEGSVIHFTTSSIYINYQLASLMPIAIKYNLELLFSGSGELGTDCNSVTSNYLQEIKGSIDAICRSMHIS